MHRLFETLRPFIRGIVQRAWLVLAAALLLSVIGVYFAQHLRIDTDFAKLLPPGYPSVEALDRLRATVGGESEAAIAIQSPSFRANRAFAEALIPRALALKGEGYEESYFTRAEFRRETQFLEDNALYFASTSELDSLEIYLRDQIEEAKLEANPFYFELDEEEEDGDTTGTDAGDNLLAAYDTIVGQEYAVSEDSTILGVRFYPSGSQTNVGFIEDAYRDLRRLVEEMNPASFQPQMEVTLAGRLYRQLVEVQTITGDVLGSFGAGVAAVLLVVVLYFFYKGYRARAGGQRSGRVLVSELLRLPVLALLIGLPLLMSLTWTFGVAYLVFGTLNLMTSTLGLVLFGLGIDYGIHFYARYTEERATGHAVAEAIETTFVSTGQAITIGALTTAAALYVLMLADFRGFSEFGFIAGTGILFALVSMTMVLPALITVLEGIGGLNLENTAAPDVQHKATERFPAARGLVLASIALVVAALALLPRVEFEYEFGKLEPDYTAYDARNAVIRQAYGGSSRRNPAYIVVDSPDEVPAVQAVLRERARTDTLSPTILDVESLQDRFPLTSDAQEAKLSRVAEVRALLADPFIEEEDTEELQKLRQAASTTAPISLEEIPEALRKQYTSKSGEIGNFIMVYPSVGLSDGRNSIAFAEDVGRVETPDGRVYHAGSTSLVAADMLRLMQREAPWMVLAALLMVLLLMWVNFRSLKWTLLALLPLAIGVLWMLLLMELFGFKLNFYNLVVLPAMLGIGEDAGVHLVHRYREEGPGSVRRVLRSTGEHVTMGSLTTMIGFGGLLLSFHPGLRSIGSLAVVGIGATLMAALVFLPALLQWLEDRRATAEPGEGTEGAGRNGAQEERSAEAALRTGRAETDVR